MKTGRSKTLYEGLHKKKAICMKQGLCAKNRTDRCVCAVMGAVLPAFAGKRRSFPARYVIYNFDEIMV